MRICLGGTFDRFHVGHAALLDAASDAEVLFVGVTDGALAVRDRDVQPWSARAEAVQAHLEQAGINATVSRLTEPMGPAATGNYDAIVVSPETVSGANAINRHRQESGLVPLAVRIVPHVLGEDRLPVSATAIAQGRIDSTGRRLQPVNVGVGSQNPVKVEAAELEIRAFLGRIPAGVEVEPVAVASGVPEQPKGDETLAGAKARAQGALAECDYGIGVEAGLIAMGGRDREDAGRASGHVDVQACVVVDRTGKATTGWGPGFQYPEWVESRALAGEMISEILGPVAEDPRIGGTTGAIGFLSDGAMDRTELTRIGVRMALVPRYHPELYAFKP